MEDNEQLFRKAFEKHADELFRHASMRLPDRDRALNLTQECFLRAWGYVQRGEEIREMRPFLFRTLRHLIIDEYRGRKKKTFSLEALKEDGFDPSFTGDSHILAESDTRVITKAMHELPDNYREVLFLRYIDELPVKEVAELVGESENAISVRIHRGLKILRKNLGIEETKII